MKIWKTYLLKKLISTFLFLLFSLFILYITVDLSAHGVRFFSKTGALEISLYYLSSFCQMLDLFFSLAFLLSSLRVLFDLSSHGEWVALQMAGISKKKLFFPFFIFASLLAILSYTNDQLLVPKTKEISKTFKASYKAKKKEKEPKLFVLSLNDDSEIVYQRFQNQMLEDVFWIESPNRIWHMKSLSLDDLKANYVDCFVKNKQGLFEKTLSTISKEFKELSLQKESFLPLTPYEYRPLFSLLLSSLKKPSDEKALFTHFYYKLFSPLVPFLILIGIAPFALSYSRNRKTFLLSSVAIFSLLALKTILDGMLILGENQVFPPLLAILSPILLISMLTLPRFVRMQ